MRMTLLAALALLPGLAMAAPEDVTVEGAWSRASIVEGRPGVAYMTLTNDGEVAMTLTGIETEVAGMAEVHRTSGEEGSGMMSMEPAGPLTVAPGERVVMEPGGLHVMLMKMTRQLEEGESYPLTLVFEGDETLEVEVPVLGVAATGPEG